MCHLPFPGQEIKGQGHTGHLNLCSLWQLQDLMEWVDKMPGFLDVNEGLSKS